MLSLVKLSFVNRMFVNTGVDVIFMRAGVSWVVVTLVVIRKVGIVVSVDSFLLNNHCRNCHCRRAIV